MMSSRLPNSSSHLQFSFIGNFSSEFGNRDGTVWHANAKSVQNFDFLKSVFSEIVFFFFLQILLVSFIPVVIVRNSDDL